jgi:hypothetical protein
MHIADPSSSGDKAVTPAILPAESGRTSGPDVPHGTHNLLPLVDPRVLQDLEDQLNGSALALRFARDYAAMWDGRVHRLAAAVQNQDCASALDAAISVKVTSAMVGGARLAFLAETLESAIRRGDFGQGQVLMERLTEFGDRTVSELQDNYILKSG